MIKGIKGLIGRHVDLWKNNFFSLRVLFHIGFLAVGILLTYYAVDYTATYSNGNIVPDLLLDLIPRQDVGLIFFQGSFIFVLSLLGLAVLIPESIPFGLATTALFFLVRAGFLTLTHLSAPYIDSYSYINYDNQIPKIIFSMTSGNDMFFSGHTGFPFVLALIFWNYKYLRYYLLLCSFIAGIAVIAGHLHYSIDVFSAFFISYGIFVISKRFFKKELAFFDQGKPSDQNKITIS